MLYNIIGFIGIFSALVVASSLNPIHRMAFLILVFLSGSFLMILLDFYFLGLTYIIVYVGAIMILFLFVIMMVQIQVLPNQPSDPTYVTSAIDVMPGNPSSWWINLIRGVILLAGGFAVIMIGALAPNGVVNYCYPSWTIEFKTMTDLETLANILYLGYPTALILIGIALWVVMIGIIKVTTPD